MFKRLLVTLDGTPHAEGVLPHALDLAKAMSAEVTLLRAIGNASSSHGGDDSGTQGRTAALRADQAHAYLDRTALAVQQGGVSASTLVKWGSPAAAIVEAADEIRADVIVMATHGRRGLNKLMLGSVAETVLHESSLPVLLVRV